MVVVGDMNARVGCDVSIWGEVLGRNGEEVCNENGRRLLQFSSEHNLWIANTWFPHKRIHKYTWECRGRGLRSMIDYFLIGKEARKQVADVKVVRGAEIGSDHYLVLMKVKLKMQRSQRTTERQPSQQIRIDRLNDNEVKWEFQAVVRAKFEEARAKGHMAGEDVEKAWKELKEGIVEAASRVCGVVKRTKCRKKRSRWWNEEVREAVKKKKLMYRRLLDTGTEESRREYNEAKVEAKKVVRRAKNEEWVQFGRELEKDACGNQ